MSEKVIYENKDERKRSVKIGKGQVSSILMLVSFLILYSKYISFSRMILKAFLHKVSHLQTELRTGLQCLIHTL